MSRLYVVESVTPVQWRVTRHVDGVRTSQYHIQFIEGQWVSTDKRFNATKSESLPLAIVKSHYVEHGNPQVACYSESQGQITQEHAV